MMKRILVSAVVATAVATFTIAGCGSSTNNNGNGTGNDGGSSSGASSSGASSGASSSGTSSGASSGSSSGSTDGGTGNPPLPDGSVYPHGNQLVPGTTLVLDGVTSDDYVVYTDTATNTAYALSLAAGSQPKSLGTVDTNGDVSVVGKVVILGTSSDQNGVGAASIWTSAASAPASLATATFVGPGGVSVSADGAHVAFLEGIDSAATTGAITIAASDGTGKTTVVPSVDLADGVCFPELGFGGAYALAAYCTAGVDAGLADGGTNPYIGIVSSFTGSSWTQATVATGVQTVFSVDKAGTKVIVNGTAGTLAYPIAGGGAVTIDATGEIGAVTYSPGLVTGDGAHVVYTTTAQALERAATTSPASPVQLAGAGTFSDVFTFSPDGSWLLGTLNQASNGNATDLFLASAATAGTPVTLSSATTAGIDGDPFTADSTHVVFFTGIAKGVGSINVQPVSGTTPTVLGTSAFTDFATSAAKLVFNANYSGTTHGADLEAVDTSQTAAPTVLVTQADPYFYTNAAKTTIVYTWSYQPGASAGLWTLAAP